MALTGARNEHQTISAQKRRDALTRMTGRGCRLTLFHQHWMNFRISNLRAAKRARAGWHCYHRTCYFNWGCLIIIFFFFFFILSSFSFSFFFLFWLGLVLIKKLSVTSLTYMDNTCNWCVFVMKVTFYVRLVSSSEGEFVLIFFRYCCCLFFSFCLLLSLWILI